MTETEGVFWGIHTKGADGDELYLRKKFIAIGWHEVGDLTKLSPDRETFKATLAKLYPGKPRGNVINAASQLFRFLHEMKPGQNVIYRSGFDHQVHIGRIDGEYQFDSSLSPRYPHQRAVNWSRALPTTHFSQGALYEIGSALTLFQVKNYADEYRAALSGHTKEEVPPAEDESVALVSEEVEQNTKDFIQKQLSGELKGYPFQEFVANLLNTMGYRTKQSRKGTDEGIDIIAHRDELQMEPPIIKIQVKSGAGSVGGPEVRELYGNIATGEIGLVVTLGSFARQALDFAKSKSNLRLIDGTELIDLVLEHYEQLDPRYKAILPLKRVYIPEPIREETE